MDKFHEQLLKTQKSGLYKVLTVYMYISIFMIIVTAGIALSGMLAWFVITIIFVATYFIARISRDKQYKEFEYIFTNGNLQIDVIFNMKKRKTLYDVELKNAEEFGKYEDVSIPNGTKEVICFPWDLDKKKEKYALILNTNGKQAVLIAPNEELLKLIKLYSARRPR